MSFNLTGGNPRAHRIRVYLFGTTVVQEGMPVCYDNSTTNWHGGSMTLGEITESTTTAEGSQNEGKYIRVEIPNADNVGMFAGVVAKGSPGLGKAGPSAIDIYVPNGAVVPVLTDLNCLADRTILAIQTGEEELGVPLETDSRAVAIARETYDRGTAGLILAELCPERFVFQDMGGTALSVDDASTTTGTMVNHINLNFLGTSSYQKGLYCKGTIGAAGSCVYGMWKFRTVLNAAAKDNVHPLCVNLHLTENATIPAVPATEHGTTAIYATVETASTAGAAYHAGDLSDGDFSMLYGGYYVKATGGNPNQFYWFHFNHNSADGYDTPNGLIACQRKADIGMVTCTGASEWGIPIVVDATPYWIQVRSART